MEQKLGKLFRESFQVKRVLNEIDEIRSLKEKGDYSIIMSMIRNDALAFKIQLNDGAFKKTKIKPIKDCVFRIMIRSNHPSHPPRIYFLNDALVNLNILPFRDYLAQILFASNIYPSRPKEQWSAKITIVNIVKSVPMFIQQRVKEHQNQVCSIPELCPTLNEFFEIDTLYNWKKTCQVHPIKLIKNSSSQLNGFMVINSVPQEIVILCETSLQSWYLTSDYIKGSHFVSLRKKKNTTSHLILEVKFKGVKNKQINGRFALEFLSQDYDAILIAIMDISKESQQNIEVSSSDDDYSSEGEEEEYQAEQINIVEVEESIIVYESLVDNQMTSENINQLVLLLKKAIEYYSASGDVRFKIYLDKMQNIFSNEMAQVLLESADERQKKPKQFKSIVDLI